jgi:hypothetical protein
VEIRLRSLVLSLLVLAGLLGAAAWGLAQLRQALPTAGTPTTPTVQPAAALGEPADSRMTFVDASMAWDWQITCGEALATWVQQLPFPSRTIRVTLTDAKNLGPSTVGVGYPADGDQAAIVYAACAGQPDLACQVAIKQGAPGADLDVAVTAAIPHAIRNAGLLHAPGGAEQIDAIRLNWSWAQFQPLLQKEGNAWCSSCLNVARP